MEEKKACKYCGCDDINLLYKQKGKNERVDICNVCIKCRSKNVKGKIIICKICNEEINNKGFANHLRNHKISTNEYYDKYVDLNSHLCRCGKKLKFYSIFSGYAKTCGDIKCIIEAKKEGNIKTCLKKYNVDNIRKSEEFKKNSKKKKLEKHNDENFNNRPKAQKTCLEKYKNPFYNNREKYKETRLKNWNMTNAGVHYSKISQELCWEVYNNLSEELQKDTYFGELNQERFVYDKNLKKLYFLDFCIESIKFCFEFQGDYWHRNPNIFTDITDEKNVEIWCNDFEKECSLFQNDYLIFIIWEETYKKYKDFCINQTLFWINFMKEIKENESRCN